MSRYLTCCAIVVLLASAILPGCHKRRSHWKGNYGSGAELAVKSPNGGEIWLMGRAQTVLWTASDPASAVDIEYTTDGSTWNPLAMGRVNDGHAPVTVPTTPSTTAQVRVTEKASGEFDVSDEVFTFAGLVVTSPNGGETWFAGGPGTVTWASGGVSGTLDIELTLDGVTWTPLAMGTANDGSETITVPYTLSTSARVRVTETGGVTDQSDAPFEIAGIEVTSPNGGEIWRFSAPGNITWLASFPGTVDIELTTDGVTWIPIALASPNDGTETIAVPATPTATARIRVSETAGTLTDVSDAVFSIQPLWELVATPLPAVRFGDLAWGDYDGDGDLDLAVQGEASVGRITRIYANAGGVFTDILAGLPGLAYSALAWGDLDNDGDLDLALSGANSVPVPLSWIYQNAGGGVFTDLGAGVAPVFYPSLAWGDYDNDGRLDLSLAGEIPGAAGGEIAPIYRNTGGGVFTDIGAGLTGVAGSSASWGDYDGDGDVDLALSGGTGALQLTRIYRNLGGGVFTDLAAGLTGVGSSALSWGDYDADGDLDLAFAGSSAAGPVSRIYRNDGGGVFTDIGAGLTGIWQLCALAWGDYDNDGDLDLALAGWNSGSVGTSLLYRNDAGVFTNTAAGFTGVAQCGLAWGDYDGDGDLDLVLSGFDGGATVMRLYRNNLGAPNAAPAAPGSPVATPGAGTVALTWTAPADDRTPTAGLSYNLRIGTTPGSSDRYASMANPVTGARRVPARGEIQGTSKTLSLPSGTYYWSVQAVDSGFAGGAWATEGSFTIP